MGDRFKGGIGIYWQSREAILISVVIRGRERERANPESSGNGV
jgi:hypothetical protein